MSFLLWQNWREGYRLKGQKNGKPLLCIIMGIFSIQEFERGQYATIMYPKIPYHSSAIKWPTHILRFRTRVDTFFGLRLRCCKKLSSEKRDNKPVLCINQNDLKLMHSTINAIFKYTPNLTLKCIDVCTKKSSHRSHPYINSRKND